MAADVSENLIRKLDELAEQFDTLSKRLLDPDVMSDHRQVRSISIKRAALEPLIVDYRAYQNAVSEADDLREMIADNADGELAEIARSELPELEEKSARLITSIQERLVTADDRAIGSIIIEIRAGVGGDEAAIWAGDLAEMYQRFAATKKWQHEVMEASPSDTGGYKNIMLRVEGEGVWAELGFEGGTHQVKRVPVTETQGRVHTSTATVAVLPEPEEVEVQLDTNDVKEMITTAQGPGGQNVNKVATAVHLIHEPTGIEVRMQETKSQSQNREKAWQLLRARLYEKQLADTRAEHNKQRNSMIGSGSRSEKIRTYRYKDNLVVDHRLGSGDGSFNLSEIMAGDLAPMIDGLIRQETAQRLAAL